ncbi:hypothetical protein ACIBTZ_22890 [Micromonospora sp. NPDC049460]|uniref:hypothetical protein n=1 Tax=Micromonospora sp. NPDC049460 TaxID=3364272 RepID=UPI0037B010D7
MTHEVTRVNVIMGACHQGAGDITDEAPKAILKVSAAPTVRRGSPNVCDRCGGEPFQRHDDNPDRITAGLQSYRPAVAATLSHYRASGKLTSIDATLTPAEITTKAIA